MHSIDYFRKLNDLTKNYKKQAKKDLSKKIIVNKSNSSSIGIGLNLSLTNSPHENSNDSLNKSLVKQYAKLTLKSILHKNEKKSTRTTNVRNENRMQSYFKNFSYVNKLVADIFDESFDQIRMKYR